jgi:HK97 family phage prohead protease
MEIKALKGREFEGYGSTFGNTDLGGDIVMPGAFTKSLTKKNPKMLYQHDPSRVPGVWRTVQEDSKGLYVHGRLIETTLGNDAYVELKEGAIDGMSIGFITVKDDGRRNPRKLQEIDLWEVSIVTFPMNESALVDSIKQFWGNVPNTKRELEAQLRSFGMSSAEAKTMISQLGKIFDSDPDGMPDGRHRDGGVEPDEVTELLEGMYRFQDSAVAGALRR